MKSRYIKYTAKRLSMLLILLIGLAGCKKWIEVAPPSTSITGASVFVEDNTAIAALTGIYTQLSSQSFGTVSLSTYSEFGGLSADELTLWGGVAPGTNLIYYYKNNLPPNTSGPGTEFWVNTYNYIYNCNAAIEGLNTSTTLTPAIKRQLLGEAEFMRAFFYFYLVNLYGDVPLALSSNYKTNESLARTPKAGVYQQIIADLKDAQNKLSPNFLDATLLNSSQDRVRPTKWAAAALLARVYLYNGDLTKDETNYTNAETESSLLINNSSLFSLSNLNNAFLKASLGNEEAIFQLQPVTASYPSNTPDGWGFILPAAGPNGFNAVYLNNTLLNSFEPGDNRKTNWIDTVTVGGTIYYYPYKYKVNDPTASVTEYEMLLRLGEQYLIRAEARAELGESTAVNDLNAIRGRAGLSNYTGATDKTSLLTAILHERQVEFFTELGQRWLDLKRTGTIDAIMSIVTPSKGGGAWNTNQQSYPIPFNDIQSDPNLKQNPGY